MPSFTDNVTLKINWILDALESLARSLEACCPCDDRYECTDICSSGVKAHWLSILGERKRPDETPTMQLERLAWFIAVTVIDIGDFPRGADAKLLGVLIIIDNVVTNLLSELKAQQSSDGGVNSKHSVNGEERSRNLEEH